MLLTMSWCFLLICRIFFVFLFFFFQAEDGIRDLYVTRVQTCALPIFEWALELRFRYVGQLQVGVIADHLYRSHAVLPYLVASSPRQKCALPSIEIRTRSEERRVGKECRSRRAPYHYKKRGEGDQTQEL